MAKTIRVALVLGMVVMVVMAMDGAKAMTICNMDSSQLAQCLPAIRGPSPSAPTSECCNIMRTADLHCLCSYKSILPNFGIDPALAMSLPKRCNLGQPPTC